MLLTRYIVTDSFLKAISAHGGLVHLIFFVDKVARTEIISVIASSRKLLTFHIITHSCVLEDSTVDLIDFKTKIRTRFAHRKLFTSGSFQAEKRSSGDIIDKLLPLMTENLWYDM